MNFFYFLFFEKIHELCSRFKSSHITNNWKSTVIDAMITIFQLIIIIKAIALN